MNKKYCISFETLYNNGVYKTKNNYIIEHTEQDYMRVHTDYYDLYAPNNELVCQDGDECKILKIDDKGYYLHSIDDPNEDSFFILTKEEFGIATFN